MFYCVEAGALEAKQIPDVHRAEAFPMSKTRGVGPVAFTLVKRSLAIIPFPTGARSSPRFERRSAPEWVGRRFASVLGVIHLAHQLREAEQIEGSVTP